MRKCLAIVLFVLHLAFLWVGVVHEHDHAGHGAESCSICDTLHAPALTEIAPVAVLRDVETIADRPAVADSGAIEVPAHHPIRGPPAT